MNFKEYLIEKKTPLVYRATKDESLSGITYWGSDLGMVKTFTGIGWKAPIFSAYLTIRNPYYADADELEYFHLHRNELKKLKSKGYDGVIERNPPDIEDGYNWQYIVFDRKQIKLKERIQ